MSNVPHRTGLHLVAWSLQLASTTRATNTALSAKNPPNISLLLPLTVLALPATCAGKTTRSSGCQYHGVSVNDSAYVWTKLAAAVLLNVTWIFWVNWSTDAEASAVANPERTWVSLTTLFWIFVAETVAVGLVAAAGLGAMASLR